MGIPANIINFDEFISLLNVKREVEFDTTPIEDILNRYFPEIIHILNKIKEQQEIKGIQRIKGFASSGEAIKYIPDYDILITGITISQSIFDRNCLDSWNIYISFEDNIFRILETIYSKDTLQHKYFTKHYPVPKGYTITMQPTNCIDIDKIYWIDLEYLELS